MSKYYTPEIEEFHVGFEYERCDDGYDWIKDSYPRAAEHIKLKNFLSYTRVKYLDREDIESEAWEYKKDRGMSENNGIMFIKPQKEFAQGFYKLRYWMNTNRISIEAVQGTVFSGTIKNKSELKKLLKQLEI